MLKMRKWQDHSECPLCQCILEDNQHVLCCPDLQAQDKMRTLQSDLCKKLAEENTYPPLMVAIASRLQSWHQGLPLEPYQHERAVRNAIAEQDLIGWWNFSLGRVSVKFAAIQNKHYESMGLRRTGAVWARKLITELNKILWQMWEHRNNVLHKTMTPQKEQQLANIREQVREQFALGKIGLSKRDHHYLDPEKKTWALQLGLEDATRWLSSVTYSRVGRLAIQNCAAAGLLMQQKFMRNWQRGLPNAPVRPITIQTTGTANPVNPTAFGDTASVSKLVEPQKDSMRVESDALMGLEIDLSDEEPSEAGYSYQSNNPEELEHLMNTLTLPDDISVFSSENSDESTVSDDMSLSSSSDTEEGTPMPPTLPDGISVFSSEDNDAHAEVDDTSSSFSFEDDSTWEPDD